ncbi:oxysterol-binding protein-related protein 9-like isoform X2 [Varroa destructor]|uniref:Oxysterol-binding protein n=2 Tax=Varroa destructor TaxID=109461 RepID=A0A7M7JV14_VARDE|nr:oxysterol-binding protein-related protein 9-like isoform X2 [Varroa destructor]
MRSYYMSKENMARGARRGCVRLQGAVIGIDDEDDSTFTIRVDRKGFHFQARDAEERQHWVRALEDTILRHTHRHAHHNVLLWERPVSVRSFEDKLAEADSYLQLLIQQVDKLQQRTESLDEKERLHLEGVCAKANRFLETVKHSIVSLQIAKNTAEVSSACGEPLDANGGSLQSLRSPTESLQISAFNSSVPATSYSSSEDSVEENSDDFFDAFEDAVSEATEGTETPSEPHHKGSAADSLIQDDQGEMFRKSRKEGHVNNSRVTSAKNHHMVNSPSENSAICEPSADEFVPFKPPPEAPSYMTPSDFDQLYEDQSEPADSNANYSVLSHLVSQVRIGMDLTKVTLPTFILERRSLLEMYADFFSHADLFASIVDQDTAEKRMVEVVRWYLSAFHAGRNAEVAKKPYNPILGEIFKCHYALPSPNIAERKAASDGPCPWAAEDDVTFVAEQVSHHPPVSAFYAECASKGITCSAHIWTKSKFLGLSVAVHNVGQGCISFQRFDEEYTCTFPSAYARSILGVPWVELGGEVTINCSKTGYNAKIDFLTKPTFGGKKHQLKGMIFRPQTDPSKTLQPFLQIQGAWNDVMTAKNVETGETFEFFNPHTTPTIKKQVRPAVETLSYESRRLWMNVTYNLREGNVDRATEHKSFLEQRQRDEARQRSESGRPWRQRLFSEKGDNWVYRNSLEKRLVGR